MSLSIRAKWTAALLLSGGLPLLLFALAALSVQQIGLASSAHEAQLASATAVATLVRTATEQAAEVTHRVGQLLIEEQIPDADAKLRLVGDLLAGAPQLLAVALYSPEGALIDALLPPGAQSAVSGPRPPERLSPTELAGEGGVWRAVDPGSPLGAAGIIVSWLEPLVAKGQRAPRAFVLGLITSAALREDIARFAEDHLPGQPDSIVVLDGELRVLLTAAPSGALPVGERLRGRDLLSSLDLPAEQLGRKRAFSTRFVTARGEPMVASVRTLPEFRWLIGVRRSEKVVLSALRGVQAALLVAAALVIAAAIGLGSFMALRTTRPVRALVELTRAYGQRRFGERSRVNSGDELEDLGRSLMQMADGLAASEREIARRARVESELSRFLPAEVAQGIAGSERALALGGQRVAVSVLFADVAAFTRYAESAPPERVVDFLNELFSVLTAIVFRHGGTVDKYIGDCIMAVFGAPTALPDHGRRALLCAEAIHRFVAAAAPGWLEAYGINTELAIGLNSGEALVGNLGSEQRMEYTAIGDVVNVSARLEGLAQPGQTLCTSAVVAHAGPGFEFRSLGAHPLRGKRQPVEIYEVL
ncbi:MAG: adenylate/guanylate cyclase domain-containing protein [Polyangia bacterium]